MNKDASCLRVLLAKNEAGRVGYCEGCDVVELEIGAMSLRIDAKDLHFLANLFKDADVRLAYYRLEKDYEQPKPAANIGHVH